jgi:hypothetical protein
MPSPKVIQLRQILADKFPGMRLHLDENPVRMVEDRPKALSPILDLFENHLVKGALNELVAGKETSGSATVMRALIGWAASQNQIIAVVDGSDSFDVGILEPHELTRLLWVRCPDADKALKAMDLLLRDGNFSLILLDLKLNPEVQLRRIPATTWYRLQRLVEVTPTICVALTPHPLIAPAQTRISLKSDFSLPDLERDASELTRELQWEMANTHHSHKTVLVHTA